MSDYFSELRRVSESKISDDMLLGVGCPDCGRKRGEWCVYMPVALRTQYAHSKDVIERQLLTGTPTKKCHNGRYGKVRDQLRKFVIEKHRASVIPATTERFEIHRAWRDCELEEWRQMRAWLTAHGRILTDADVRSV